MRRADGLDGGTVQLTPEATDVLDAIRLSGIGEVSRARVVDKALRFWIEAYKREEPEAWRKAQGLLKAFRRHRQDRRAVNARRRRRQRRPLCYWRR